MAKKNITFSLEKIKACNAKHSVTCGDCGDAMRLKNSKYGVFWGCVTYPVSKCPGTHGAHPDGTPLGVPADKETKEWRIEAHAVFEEWQTSNNLSRDEAYEQLQRIMGLTSSEAHIGKFDRAQCEELIDLLNEEGA